MGARIYASGLGSPIWIRDAGDPGSIEFKCARENARQATLAKTIGFAPVGNHLSRWDARRVAPSATPSPSVDFRS
jgi:hypothetical protein